MRAAWPALILALAAGALPCMPRTARALDTAAPPAGAAAYRVGNLVVEDPWSRPTPPGTAVGVIYLSVRNTGRSADRLLSVTSPRAQHAEIHESSNVHGMMIMRRVEGLDCPPRATVHSAPGGIHIMLVGLDAPLAAGGRFEVTLRFKDAGAITVPVSVEARTP